MFDNKERKISCLNAGSSQAVNAKRPRMDRYVA